MSKKYLASILIASAIFAVTSQANAYTQNTLFGTGYGFAGYNNYSNGAAQTSAIKNPKKEFVQTTQEISDESFKYTEQKVSDVIRDHDEAPNAGYKTKYTYIEKDMSDFNPYTGADSGVNDTKSIYTDDLGRLHFFGKGSRFKN